MDQLSTFEQFLATSSGIEISLTTFFLNFLLAAFYAVLIEFVYVRWGHSLSNRRQFARNFFMISVTTMFIISVVKSSLALSLGLVGALSIVRFRAAIKEPEELAFLFLAIAVGLGLGADHRGLTLVAVATTLILLYIRYQIESRKSAQGHNLYVSVVSDDPSKDRMGHIASVLKDHCRSVGLKRLDSSKELLEAMFLVHFDNFEKLEQARDLLQKQDESLKVSFVDTLNLD